MVFKRMGLGSSLRAGDGRMPVEVLREDTLAYNSTSLRVLEFGVGWFLYRPLQGGGRSNISRRTHLEFCGAMRVEEAFERSVGRTPGPAPIHDLRAPPKTVFRTALDDTISRSERTSLRFLSGGYRMIYMPQVLTSTIGVRLLLLRLRRK